MATVQYRDDDETSLEDVSSNHPLPVAVVESRVSNPTTGKVSTTSLGTTVASALQTASYPCREVMIQNDPDNTVDVLVGLAESQTIQVRPGDVLTLPIRDVNMVYAKNLTSTTQSINWLAVI